MNSGADLLKMQPAAIVPVMSGVHRAACYFLWPVMAQVRVRVRVRARVSGLLLPMPGEG